MGLTLMPAPAHMRTRSAERRNSAERFIASSFELSGKEEEEFIVVVCLWLVFVVWWLFT